MSSDRDVNAMIEEALGRVLDPCSVASRAPLSVLDMGMVRAWHLYEGGRAVVKICLTTPACTMVGHLVSGIERSLSELPQVQAVEVEIVSGLFWGPEMMSEQGQMSLEQRRARAMELSGVQPRQWKRQAREDRERPRDVAGARVGGG